MATHGGFVSWYVDLCKQGIAAHPAGWYRRWLQLRGVLPRDEPMRPDEPPPSTNEYDPHLPGSRVFLRRQLETIELRERWLWGFPLVVLRSREGVVDTFMITVQHVAEDYAQKIRRVFPGLLQQTRSW